MRDGAPVQNPIGQAKLTIHGQEYTADVMVSNSAWLAWLAKGRDLYQSQNRYTDPRFSQYGKEPQDPYLYLIAYANGTDWDPTGEGAGVYCLYPTGWRLLVGTPDFMAATAIDPSRQIAALSSRIQTLEVQLSMYVNDEQQIKNLKQEVSDLKTQLNME